jgi:hypothetical protein
MPVLLSPSPKEDAPWVAMSSIAKMPIKAEYWHIALLETDGKTTPKMLSARARGVKQCIKLNVRPAHVGTTERGAAQRFCALAIERASHMNRLHGAKSGKRPITHFEVTGATNETIRRDYLEHYIGGIGGFLADACAIIVHHDDAGKLWILRSSTGQWMSWVEVKCPSTGRKYFLRVPPDMVRAREAVAWTFNVPEADYRPTVQT